MRSFGKDKQRQMEPLVHSQLHAAAPAWFRKCLSSGTHTHETSSAQEPAASDESDQCDGCGGPQEGLEKVCGTSSGFVLRVC